MAAFLLMKKCDEAATEEHLNIGSPSQRLDLGHIT
jgi:hypothetical protein